MTRIILFLLTNAAILVVLTLVLGLLDRTGVLPAATLGGYGPLLAMAAAFGFGGSIISLLLSKTIAKWSTGAHVIEQPRTEVEAWLIGVVGRLAKQSGIGMPEVAIYESDDMNAFATGASRNGGLVAVSTGLLNRMPRPEVEAVLAHEVAHIANGDMVTLSLLQGVLNTFVIFASRVIGGVVDAALSRGGDERRGPGFGYWIVVMVLELVFGVLATIIAMWFSRRREFRADAGSAQLVGAASMAAALRRLQSAHEPAGLPSSLAAFGIRGGGALGKLFASHPPIEARIAALAQHSRSVADGRDRRARAW